MWWRTSEVDSHVLSYLVPLTVYVSWILWISRRNEREQFDSRGFMDAGPLAPGDGWAALSRWLFDLTPWLTGAHLHDPCLWQQIKSSLNQPRSFSGNFLKVCGKDTTFPLQLYILPVIVKHWKLSLGISFTWPKAWLCSRRAKWWIPLTLDSVNEGESRFLFSQELTGRW